MLLDDGARSFADASTAPESGAPRIPAVVAEPGLRRLSPPAWLRRGIGVLIPLLVLTAALALLLAVNASGSDAVTGTAQRWAWGPFSFVYSATRPPLMVVVGAIALGMTAIVLTAGLTLRFLRTSRTSLDPSTYPLSPHKIMVATRGRFDGPVTLTLLVPAHNEAERIGATLASLEAQTRRPDRVIVVADNCTDATEAIARAAGAEVRVTVGNRDKKAGALNQVLRDVLPDGRPQRRHHGDGCRHRPQRALPRGGRSPLHRRSGADGPRRGVPGRARPRPAGRVPAQRVRPLRPARSPVAGVWWTS